MMKSNDYRYIEGSSGCTDTLLRIVYNDCEFETWINDDIDMNTVIYMEEHKPIGVEIIDYTSLQLTRQGFLVDNILDK